jgi:hypothetical protein
MEAGFSCDRFLKPLLFPSATAVKCMLHTHGTSACKFSKGWTDMKFAGGSGVLKMIMIMQMEMMNVTIPMHPVMPLVATS